MKKSICFVLPLVLLASCGSKVPQDIQDYINNCSLDKAQSFVKTAHLSVASSYYDTTSNKVIGTSGYTVKVDRNDYENYHSLTVEAFTGTGVVKDEDSQLYVIDTTAEISKSAEDSSLFLSHLVKHGYDNEEKTGEVKEWVEDVKFNLASLKEESTKLFYSSSTLNSVSGGIYYADFFKSKINYYPYMSIDSNNIFTFKLEKYPVKTDTEQGFYNETLHMNEYGLVIDVDQDIINYTTNRESKMTATATYNSTIDFD